MREYITIIAGAAVLSVFADIVSPENWKKYIKIVTGIVIACVIIQPIAELRNIDIFSGFESSDKSFEYEENNMISQVTDQLCMNIQKDIKERVYDKTGESVECDVKIVLNDEGLIERVDKIYIYGDISADMRSELAYIYGLDLLEVVIYGE